jgi:type II secretory pathway component PulF
MALYSYEAYGKDGKKVKGIIDAPTQGVVKDILSKQGLYVINVKSVSQESQGTFLQRIFRRSISIKDKILFTKQLTVLLRSGIPLLEALELLTEQLTGPLRGIVVAIKDDIKQGASFADALKKYPKTFDTIYVQLVRAGEASGKLEAILDRLSSYLERREEVTKKIKGALRYPIIQLIIVVIVVMVLLTVVIPQMQDVFTSIGSKLPWTTRFVIAAGDFLKAYFIIVLLVPIIGIIGFRYWKRTASGGRLWDTFKIKMPVIKYVTKTNAVVQFCYTLGLLLESGVNLAEALDIVCKVIDNRVLADVLIEARDKIIKQGKIAQYLKQTNLFPPIAIHLIKTGEESGQLDSMLLLIAKNYEVELNELIDNATGLLSPIMLVVMAVVIGFVIMAVAGPMMNLSQSIGVQ